MLTLLFKNRGKSLRTETTERVTELLNNGKIKDAVEVAYNNGMTAEAFSRLAAVIL